MARCGFIAIELINSLVEKRIITNREKSDFLNSINTIASSLNNDVFTKNKRDFLKNMVI